MAKFRDITLGRNRGKNRIWLQSKTWMPEVGFFVGAHFNATIEPNKVTLEADDMGKRKVSGKGDTSIIDINTDQLQFDNRALRVRYEPGKITITPKKD